jgi:hypothetical protein
MPTKKLRKGMPGYPPAKPAQPFKKVPVKA